MESAHKRLKSDYGAGEDFVSLNTDSSGNKYGYGDENGFTHARRPRDGRSDRRHAQDRPKSKHALPGHEPWVLIKTKPGRRFVHNTQTKESLWRVPPNVMPAVLEFERGEVQQKEKEDNARWAEEQWTEMRATSKAEEVHRKADDEEKAGRSRRRRSESLQREDEEALMAELAAQAGQAEEQDVKAVMRTIEPQAGDVGYDSEGSYEYVEVTDSEDEGGERTQDGDNANAQANGEPMELTEQQDQGKLVEFGEDDIAYQLAAMGEEYGLDPGEYGDADPDDAWDEGAEGLPLSDEDAANLFKDMLEDHHVSPFTPWEKLIADESETSILADDRYTVLPSMRVRKEVWDAWTRERAARLKEERARMEKTDPRIPYLALLADKATPKLYWPEFKRKYKRDAEMNERRLGDKEREKLYRDHIHRLKLPESTRTADLMTLLDNVPLRHLNRDSSVDALPRQLLSHLHFISLPASTRDRIIRSHIRNLPPAPEKGDGGDDDDMTAEDRAAENKRREERARREAAMAERERKVEEERKTREKEERFAKRGLLEEERELRRAMAVGAGSGLKARLAESN